MKIIKTVKLVVGPLDGIDDMCRTAYNLIICDNEKEVNFTFNGIKIKFSK